MTGQNAYQLLASKALADDQFARRLMETPESALREVGVDPTPEILEALRGIDVAALRRLATAFGEEKAAV